MTTGATSDRLLASGLKAVIPSEIRPGLRAEREIVVTDAMVTRHVGGGRGGVLTTPTLIALMEEVAQAVTEPYLPAGHTTVGFEVSVRHRRPAFVGARVRVMAELREIEGRKLRFGVAAWTEHDEIAAGVLRRTIIRLGDLDAARG